MNLFIPKTVVAISLLMLGLAFSLIQCDSDDKLTATDDLSSIQSCALDSDCTVMSSGCCGCSFTAIRVDSTDKYKAPDCTQLGCPSPLCENPGAVCEAGICAVTACTNPSCEI